jgi:hypothetical protein
MSTNPYVVNIVPLQGIATGITSSSDTAGQILNLQTSIANIQTMVNYDTHTISTDFITSFTEDQRIQVTENINLSSVSLYQNGSLVTLGENSGSTSTIQSGLSSFITCQSSTITFVSAGNNRLQINETGTAGVQVNGDLYVSGNAFVTTLFQTSDREHKMEIRPFTTCLEDVLKLEPCYFKWKETSDSDMGFIAQDVKKVWPSLTEGNTIAYSRFIPLLLEGLRELNGRVSTLEARHLSSY